MGKWIAVAMCLVASAVSAQTYPSKAVRVVVPFAPGGGADNAARGYTTKLQQALGQPFVIENRGGAGSLIGTEVVAKSPADGYTILITSDSFSASAATHRPAFDPMNSLVPVVELASAPFGLTVHPSVPARTVAEFIALAKAKPDAFSYGSSGTGGLTHLITEMFSGLAGIKMVHVPYKSTGAATPDLLSGSFQVYVGNVSPLLPYIQSGRLKLLGVTNARRWPLLPDVPTIGETVKGFAADPWIGLFVPKGTPPDVIKLLNDTVNRIQSEDEVNKYFAAQGMLPKGGSPAEFEKLVRDDFARWTKVVQEIGFKPD